MSASSQTIVAALPPSSRTSRLAPAARATAAPVSALPVKLMTPTSGRGAQRRADVAAAVQQLHRLRRHARLEQQRDHRRAESPGACGGGLTIVVLPAANEAPSLCASRFAGALNGVIASATPAGAR